MCYVQKFRRANNGCAGPNFKLVKTNIIFSSNWHARVCGRVFPETLDELRPYAPEDGRNSDRVAHMEKSLSKVDRSSWSKISRNLQEPIGLTDLAALVKKLTKITIDKNLKVWYNIYVR